jgi:hypothetical protein
MDALSLFPEGIIASCDLLGSAGPAGIRWLAATRGPTAAMLATATGLRGKLHVLEDRKPNAACNVLRTAMTGDAPSRTGRMLLKLLIAVVPNL